MFTGLYMTIHYVNPPFFTFKINTHAVTTVVQNKITEVLCRYCEYKWEVTYMFTVLETFQLTFVICRRSPLTM